MKSHNKTTRIGHEDIDMDAILADAQDGWKAVNPQSSIDASVDKVNNFVNKNIDAKKKKRKISRPSQKMGISITWAIIILIVILISFAIILNII